MVARIAASQRMGKNNISNGHVADFSGRGGGDGSILATIGSSRLIPPKMLASQQDQRHQPFSSRLGVNTFLPKRSFVAGELFLPAANSTPLLSRIGTHCISEAGSDLSKIRSGKTTAFDALTTPEPMNTSLMGKAATLATREGGGDNDSGDNSSSLPAQSILYGEYATQPLSSSSTIPPAAAMSPSSTNLDSEWHHHSFTGNIGQLRDVAFGAGSERTVKTHSDQYSGLERSQDAKMGAKSGTGSIFYFGGQSDNTNNDDDPPARTEFRKLSAEYSGEHYETCTIPWDVFYVSMHLKSKLIYFLYTLILTHEF
jgi:hypothetical protein